MTVNRFIAYGDYADGYCEDWAPAGSPALFTAAGGLTFAPGRFPGYPTYVMRWQQSVVHSAGADTVASAPYLQELLIRLPWSAMAAADKSSLEAFYVASAVSGMAGQFSYFNPLHGPALPVRFAEPALPLMPEVAYGRYRVELLLRVDINYPQQESSGVPPAITGNRFVVGGVAMPFPGPLRPATGYGLEIPQTLERNSAGSPVIYTKSTLSLQRHRYAMVLDHDGFIRLQAFFFSFTHGRRKPFTWYDLAGGARTMRLADAEITVRQVAYNRYMTELGLLEEI